MIVALGRLQLRKKGVCLISDGHDDHGGHGGRDDHDVRDVRDVHDVHDVHDARDDHNRSVHGDRNGHGDGPQQRQCGQQWAADDGRLAVVGRSALAE